MAFHQVTATSLTPSRPAPQAPQRRGAEQPLNMYTTLSAAGYNSSFGYSATSPSASSYATTYSGIGGSPNRSITSVNSSGVVRSGWASVKEDAFASLFWVRKWLILNEQSLSFHKNEVRLKLSWRIQTTKSCLSN